MTAKISGVLITRNEEKNIGQCLQSISFCSEIVVVDSGSGDATVQIARQTGAQVYKHEFRDYAEQKNFAISKASGDWVLLIDADERVSPELADAIIGVIQNVQNIDGYYLRRRNQIFGRWMRGGANSGDDQLRLVRRKKAKFEGIVHERIYLKGPAGRLKAPLYHLSTPDVRAYTRKLNEYTALEAQILSQHTKSYSIGKMKSRPVMEFIRLWFLRAGFRDGMEGFIFTVLSAYYVFVKWAKVWEMESGEKA